MSDHDEEIPISPSPVAVIDIDGVLADVRHRLHHLRGARKDWRAFFAEVGADPLMDQGHAAATDAAGQGLGIVYLTGRPERCRAETASWLARHGLPAGTLLMRPERDRRPAREYKVQALRELSREREVAWLLDDDGEVVTAVQAAGFPAVLADWTVREDVLRDAQEGSGRT